MFLGEFRHSLDNKGRITLPAKFRTQLSNQVFVSKGFDGCLELRGEKEFKEYAEKLSKLSNTSKKARLITRHIIAQADDPELDKVGRIKINKILLEKANIEKKVAIVGNIDRLEIWDSEKWDKYLKDTENELEDIADLLSESEFL